MADIHQARLRHATYYVRLAKAHQADQDQMRSELANFIHAGNYCIQLTDWNLLATLTDAINEYLLKGRWLDYIKLNTPLVKRDLTEQREARITRVLQLIELEENRGNYSQAVDWNRLLLELHQGENNQDTIEVLGALWRLVKLSVRQGKDHDAVEYLMQGLAIAREVADLKKQTDFLFELALVYKRQEQLGQSRLICENALNLAGSIGYSVAELDIISLMASLDTKVDRNRALEFYRQAIAIAESLGDVERQFNLQGELLKLLEIISIEQAKKRKIFISYNHQDRPFVERLAKDLRRQGFVVWWDHWEIRVGESIIQRINDGIESSAYLIAVLSSNSVQSDFVQREIGSALMKQLTAEKDIVILPLLAADCQVPTLLRDIKWADFRNDYEQGLESLLQRLDDTIASQL